jgi:hypothetical protein
MSIQAWNAIEELQAWKADAEKRIAALEDGLAALRDRALPETYQAVTAAPNTLHLKGKNAR